MKKALLILVTALALLGIVVLPALAGGPPAGKGWRRGRDGKGNGAGRGVLYDSVAYTCDGGATDIGGPTFGFVIMNANGRGDLIVQVSLKGATANATYDIWVNQWQGACPLSSPTAPGALLTDDLGNGNAHVKVGRVEGATNFWVSAVGGAQVLRSTAVILD